MQETIGFLNKLADASGAMARHYFRHKFITETKERHDPVTEADRAIEKALSEHIHETYPDDGIQGEEFGVTKGVSGRVWVIDPIDGTRAFAIGRATFATLVALCIDGVPVAGLIDQPVIGDRWIGAAGVTTHNKRPVRTRACAEIENAALILTSPDQFRDGREINARNQIVESCRFTAYGGDCYAYGLIASGYADAMMESHLKAHDILPLVPVIQGAGGVITDWNGDVPTLSNLKGNTLACGDPKLHQRLLALVA